MSKNLFAVGYFGSFLLLGMATAAISQGFSNTGGVAPGSTSVLQASPSDPAGTTSAAGVMMGLGSTCAITPKFSTRVHMQIIGNLTNDTASDGAGVYLYYGTGNAPANAASVPGGSVRLSTPNGLINGSTGTSKYSFNVSGLATGLTVGTALWIDANLFRVTGGTASIKDSQCTAFEVL